MKRILRHKDNIGKRVRYIGETPAYLSGEEGTLKGFRGNKSTYPFVIPYCQVFFDRLDGTSTYAADMLAFVD